MSFMMEHIYCLLGDIYDQKQHAEEDLIKRS